MLSNEAKLQEATLDVFSSLGGWNARDLQFATSDYSGNPGNSAIAPPWYQQNQKFGESIPVYRTEVELRLIRDRMRIMAANNEFALCALENRVNYVVGDGFKYSATAKDVSSDRCRKAAARVQAVIDGWCEINDTPTLEADTLWRLDTEGEAFLRCFPDRRGWMHIRFVEPEHVTYLYGDQNDPENSFGVVTDHDDTETVHAYHVVEDPLEGIWDTKKVNADKILHLKANTRRGAKRGLSVFYPVESNLRRCEDLLASMTSVAKARAKIALIRKITGLTTPTANSLLDKLTSVRATDPATNETLNIERLRYGTVLTASANTDYQMPSVQLGASDIVEVLQAELRAVASRLSMPEWMFTALADAKYSNAFVVEAPTLKSFRRIQRHLRNGFGLCRYGHRRALLWRQLLLAVDAGLLTPEDLDDVTIGCEAPTLEARDRIQEVERHEKLVQAGFESKETAQRSLELDCDIENPQIEREQIGKARPVTDATAVLQIQTAYIGGQLPRPAAAANLRILLGFTEEQAELLLPLDKAVKRVDDGNAPGAGGPDGGGAPGDGGGMPGGGGAPAGAAPAPVDAAGGAAPGAVPDGDPAGAAPGTPAPAAQPSGDDAAADSLLKSIGAQEQTRLTHTQKLQRERHQLREEGKSGVFTDAAGHKYRLENGVRVPLGENEPAAQQQPAAQQPAQQQQPTVQQPSEQPKGDAPQKATAQQPSEQPKVNYPKGFKPGNAELNKPNEHAPNGMRPDLTPEEAQAIVDYSDVHVYGALNECAKPFKEQLRNGNEPKAKGFFGRLSGGGDPAKVHKLLKQAFAKVPPIKPPVTVHRAISVGSPADTKAFAEFFASQAGKGTAVSLPSYQSTSLVKAPGSEDQFGQQGTYSGEINFCIHATHGLDVMPYSRAPGEKEILLPHAANYTVGRVEQRGGKWHIELFQIHPSASESGDTK